LSIQAAVMAGRSGRGHRRRLVAVALAAGLTGAAAPAAAVTETCDKVDGAHSVSYDLGAVLTIVNYLDHPVLIYWLNYQGNRVLYRTLGPGDGYPQKTFFTHVWLATTEDGSCAGLFQVDRQSDRFAIRAETVPAALPPSKPDARLKTLAPGWQGGE